MAFAIQHTMSMRHIIFSCVACPVITHFPTLSHKTICYRKKCFRTRNGCSEFLYNFFRNISQSYKNLAIYCNNSSWKDRCERTCSAEIQVRIDNGVLPGGLLGTCWYLCREDRGPKAARSVWD